MNTTVDAEKWYDQAIKIKQNPETYYRYVLKSNGKYLESNAQMNTFAALAPTDESMKNLIRTHNILLT
jgi:hypothetical protein